MNKATFVVLTLLIAPILTMTRIISKHHIMSQKNVVDWQAVTQDTAYIAVLRQLLIEIKFYLRGKMNHQLKANL